MLIEYKLTKFEFSYIKTLSIRKETILLKTKFDDLLKIRKQQVDKLERDLEKVNSAINNIQKQIEIKHKELEQLSIPKSGKFYLINQLKHNIFLINQEIKTLKNQLNTLNERKELIINNLKSANIEYEKIVYLKNEEIKKEIKKIKNKEIKEIDEIAIMLNNLK